jgi:hypothetical protein
MELLVIVVEEEARSNEGTAGGLKGVRSVVVVVTLGYRGQIS